MADPEIPAKQSTLPKIWHYFDTHDAAAKKTACAWCDTPYEADPGTSFDCQRCPAKVYSPADPV